MEEVLRNEAGAGEDGNCAVGIFPKDGVDPEQRTAYAEYLKPRIRNAVETLIEEDEPDKIEVLEQAGWFGQKEVEDFTDCQRAAEVTGTGVSDEAERYPLWLSGRRVGTVRMKMK